MKIIIVDDDAGVSQVLAAICAAAGHEVLARLPDGDGLEAAVARLRPDLVCLDFHLPGRDGMALLAVLQQQAPALDVVFITGSDDQGLAQRAADAGASGFIKKPFTQEKILAELAAIVETRAAAARGARQAADAAPAAWWEGGGAAKPAGAVSAMASPAAAAGQPRPASAGRGSVVIADDNMAVRLLLKGLLDECGLRVIKMVSNGADAVQAVRDLRPAILCLDVNMPVLGGLEALPLVREVSPQTAVVMVTGCAERAFVTRAAKHGARGYILKPLRPAYVHSVMQRLG